MGIQRCGPGRTHDVDHGAGRGQSLPAAATSEHQGVASKFSGSWGKREAMTVATLGGSELQISSLEYQVSNASSVAVSMRSRWELEHFQVRKAGGSDVLSARLHGISEHQRLRLGPRSTCPSGCFDSRVQTPWGLVLEVLFFCGSVNRALRVRVEQLLVLAIEFFISLSAGACLGSNKENSRLLQIERCCIRSHLIKLRLSSK